MTPDDVPLTDGVDFDGLRIEDREDGFLFETPEISREGLNESGVQDLAQEYDEYVSNWYYFEHVLEAGEAGRAFLRWVEHAETSGVPQRYDALREGITRTWGQLAITVTMKDGDRRYDLRHEDDLGTDLRSLDRYDDPLDAREITKFDTDDRYRPLKTAPSLITGWTFPDLTGVELVDAVDFFYPATIENWHLEHNGDLDVAHWRETVDRQTGIYGVVQTWDRGEGHEHVNWVAEACCVDSQCLRRREWEYDDETDLDVDGGDGQFPCREPCSLVISGARTWTRLEGEEPTTYEFELTPSEKEQLDAIVEAVADGRIDDIREADFDDPANRYRVRYLRAKRFMDREVEKNALDDESDVPSDGA